VGAPQGFRRDDYLPRGPEQARRRGVAGCARPAATPASRRHDGMSASAASDVQKLAAEEGPPVTLVTGASAGIGRALAA